MRLYVSSPPERDKRGDLLSTRGRGRAGPTGEQGSPNTVLAPSPSPVLCRPVWRPKHTAVAPTALSPSPSPLLCQAVWRPKHTAAGPAASPPPPGPSSCLASAHSPQVFMFIPAHRPLEPMPASLISCTHFCPSSSHSCTHACPCSFSCCAYACPHAIDFCSNVLSRCRNPQKGPTRPRVKPKPAARALCAAVLLGYCRQTLPSSLPHPNANKTSH